MRLTPHSNLQIPEIAGVSGTVLLPTHESISLASILLSLPMMVTSTLEQLEWRQRSRLAKESLWGLRWLAVHHFSHCWRSVGVTRALSLCPGSTAEDHEWPVVVSLWFPADCIPFRQLRADAFREGQGGRQEGRNIWAAGEDIIPRSVFCPVSDYSGPTPGSRMDMTSRNSRALPLLNELSLRVVVGLFTFCWLGGSGQTGFFVSFQPTWEVGPSLG